MKRAGITYISADDVGPCLAKDRADELCESIAEQLSLKPGGDILKAVKSLGGRLHYVDECSSLIGGNTIYVHGECDFDIYLPIASSVRRDRFTVAHELGHYVLHSDQGKRPLMAQRSGSTRAEWEANWFAASLLMPSKEFKALAQKGTTIPVLADHFKVSSAAVEVRKKNLGL